MKYSTLTYGPAESVASWLSVANEIDPSILTSALINALNRIDTLEKQIDAVRNLPLIQAELSK